MDLEIPDILRTSTSTSKVGGGGEGRKKRRRKKLDRNDRMWIIPPRLPTTRGRRKRDEVEKEKKKREREKERGAIGRGEERMSVKNGRCTFRRAEKRYDAEIRPTPNPVLKTRSRMTVTNSTPTDSLWRWPLSLCNVAPLAIISRSLSRKVSRLVEWAAAGQRYHGRILRVPLSRVH